MDLAMLEDVIVSWGISLTQIWCGLGQGRLSKKNTLSNYCVRVFGSATVNLGFLCIFWAADQHKLVTNMAWQRDHQESPAEKYCQNETTFLVTFLVTISWKHGIAMTGKTTPIFSDPAHERLWIPSNLTPCHELGIDYQLIQLHQPLGSNCSLGGW